MKAVVLIVKYADGSIGSIAGESAAAVREKAAAIRQSGKHDGKPVSRGVVLSTQQHGPLLKFRIEPKHDAKPEAPAEGEPKPAKAEKAKKN